MFKRLMVVIPFIMLIGCASLGRQCSGCMAEGFGADWIVITRNMTGDITSCWQLKNTSVDNEHGSDGVWWKDCSYGHLIHISGWYERVQVEKDDFKTAAKQLNVELDRCPGGKYLPKKE